MSLDIYKLYGISPDTSRYRTKSEKVNNTPTPKSSKKKKDRPYMVKLLYSDVDTLVYILEKFFDGIYPEDEGSDDYNFYIENFRSYMSMSDKSINALYQLASRLPIYMIDEVDYNSYKDMEININLINIDIEALFLGINFIQKFCCDNLSGEVEYYPFNFDTISAHICDIWALSAFAKELNRLNKWENYYSYKEKENYEYWESI